MRLRSKSAALSSCSSSASSSSSQSAQVTERFTIRRNAFTCASRPLVAEDHRDFGDAQLARGFQPQVAVNDLAVAAGQHGDLEAELANAAAHAIDRGVVLAGIACVEDQSVNGPNLDFRGLRRLDHSAISPVGPAPKHYWPADHRFSAGSRSSKHDYKETNDVCKMLLYMELIIAKECD